MAISPAASKFPFLQHGKPFYGANEFKKNQSNLRHYPKWEAVVFVGRWWCMSIRRDKVRPPAALLIFGVDEPSDNKENEVDKVKQQTEEVSNSNNAHFLLFATVLDDAKPLTASEELIAAIDNCPGYYRPATVTISYYSQVQHTLDVIRSVRGSEVSRQIMEIIQKEKFTTATYFLRDLQENKNEHEQNKNTIVQRDTTPVSPPKLIEFGVSVRQNEKCEGSSSTSSSSLPAAITSSASSSEVLSLSEPAAPPIECCCVDTFMESVAQWMREERQMFPDASTKSFATFCNSTGNAPCTASASSEEQCNGATQQEVRKKQQQEEKVRAAAAANEILGIGACFPQLSTMRVSNRQPKQPTGKNNKTNDLSGSGAAVDNIASPSDLISGVFTVPESYLPNNKYPHVLFLQRPSAVLAKGGNPAAPSGNFANNETAAAAASEGIELGPTQPQPIGIELHLHTDPGDAAYVHSILSKPLNVQLYEDLLHPDGEVYVQFGPVEGAAVVDAEAAIRAFHYYNHQHKTAVENNGGSSSSHIIRWGFTSSVPTLPNPIEKESNSCSVSEKVSSRQSSTPLRPVGYASANFHVPVPRVVFNAPTGKTERRTPLEAPKTVLESSSPSFEMLEAAAAAVKYFVKEMIAWTNKNGVEEEVAAGTASVSNSSGLGGGKENAELVDGGGLTKSMNPPRTPPHSSDVYEIDWSRALLDLTPRGTEMIGGSEEEKVGHPNIEDPTSKSTGRSLQVLHMCNFCRRQRLKMMRCGGCKVTSYCCKDHQVKDWKGQHKNECKLLKVADEEFKAEILSIINLKKAKVEESLTVPAYVGGEEDSQTNESIRKKCALEAGGEGFDSEDASNALTFLKLLDVCKMNAFSDSNNFDANFVARVKATVSGRVAALQKQKGVEGGSSSAAAVAAASGNDDHFFINVHVLNVEDVFGFMSALAAWWDSSTAQVEGGEKERKQTCQYRIIMANGKSIKPADQNKVFALRRRCKKQTNRLSSPSSATAAGSDTTGSEFVEVESTGVLGDLWRTQRRQVDEEAKLRSEPFLVRLYSDRYHNCAEKLYLSGLLAPHCVLSLGSKTTEGQSFFNASTEVIADDVLGYVPFAAAEPHYLAIYRTISALNNRMSLSPVNKNPSLGDADGLLNSARVNKEGICQVAVTDGGEDLAASQQSSQQEQQQREGGVSNSGLASSAVPLYLNAYFTAMLPK